MKPLLASALVLVAASSFASVVQPVGAAPQVLIPAAGSTTGANGTFFRSDIAIVNLVNRDQNVLAQWLPQAGTGNGAEVTFTIPALTGVRVADFVADRFGVSGLGSIILSGIVPGTSLTIDPTARLFVSERIWTQQPGTGGTTSQSFPAIPLQTINTPSAALFGLGGPDDPSLFRVNVGIVNVDPKNTQTYVVTPIQQVFPPTTIQVILPPLTMQQVPVGGAGSVSQINVTNTTPTATRSNLWTAYGSSIDNITGDAWSELAVVGTATP
ncbi:MAG TPA: hypothetical protein VF980_19900 [Thermoanaerobaculia bacterium]